MLHGGSTLQQIGDRAKISRQAVWERLHRIRLTGGIRVDVVRLLQLIRAPGVTKLTHVAQALDVSRSQVVRALQELMLTDAVNRLLQWRVDNERRRQRERVVAALRRYARRLRRTPGLRDLVAKKRPRDIPAFKTLQRLFGSLTGAQRAAGLALNGRGAPRNARRKRGVTDDLAAA